MSEVGLLDSLSGRHAFRPVPLGCIDYALGNNSTDFMKSEFCTAVVDSDVVIVYLTGTIDTRYAFLHAATTA